MKPSWFLPVSITLKDSLPSDDLTGAYIYGNISKVGICDDFMEKKMMMIEKIMEKKSDIIR